jgi:hypothetical protein
MLRRSSTPYVLQFRKWINVHSTNTPLQSDVAEVKVVKGSEAYNEALIKEAPPLWHWTTWKLFGCLLLGCFAQTMVSNSLYP